MRRAFTLTELMVVVSLIIVMTTLSVPAIQVYLEGREKDMAVQTFAGAVANAQAQAKANFTTTVVRVERAFRTDDAGRMIKDGAGRPFWLDHQRIQILGVGLRQAKTPISGEELRLPKAGGCVPDRPAVHRLAGPRQRRCTARFRRHCVAAAHDRNSGHRRARYLLSGIHPPGRTDSAACRPARLPGRDPE